MQMKKGIYTMFRFSFPIIGFFLVCLGAFYVSSSYSNNSQNETIVAYTLMPLGFVLLLVGIFWSTYHEANHKSLFHNVIRRIHNQQQVQIETIDRPDYYPPSYDSVIWDISLHLNTNRQIILCEQSFNIPPPLYSENVMDVVDETYLCEDPPPSYEVSVRESTSDSAASLEGQQETDNISNLETND
ncbi:transmembrane protein 252 [Pseudophryne corroboree]|uniref:transmembrane protein 252 n=1 Tax=Pseudophryne corroboree TaxID=495146 RepID=UPI003081CE60